MDTLQCDDVADVIWEEMTCQLDTWHGADLTWIIGNGHGARIRGGDRWNLSRTADESWSLNLILNFDRDLCSCG
jgi:hypothetical protein